MSFCQAVKEGYRGFVLFVIQMTEFSNLSLMTELTERFGDALRQAVKEGVAVLAYDCNVTEDTLELKSNSSNVGLGRAVFRLAVFFFV